MIILRLLHIALGATWTGFAVFMAFYLSPSLQDVGPDGGKVIAALQRRGLMTVMPMLAIVTIVSGVWLLYRVSGGFGHDYLLSKAGHVFAMGGLLALIGFIVGMSVTRPAMLKIGELMQSLGPGTSPEDREQVMKEVGRLRSRGALGARALAVLLLAATAAMAVARYL